MQIKNHVLLLSIVLQQYRIQKEFIFCPILFPFVSFNAHWELLEKNICFYVNSFFSVLYFSRAKYLK